MNNNGLSRQLEDGQWQQEVDYVKALELYRRVTTEFVKGETRYFDQAEQLIKSITTPTISIGVSNVFLPGSGLQFGLNARNVRRVDFALYRVDLTRDVRFTRISDEDEGEAEDNNQNWIQKLQVGGKVAVKNWSRDLSHKETTNQSANKCALTASSRSARICWKPGVVRSLCEIWYWLPTPHLCLRLRRSRHWFISPMP